MLVLVLNIGSGSQKLSLFDFESENSRKEPTPPNWQVRIDSTAPGQPVGELFIEIKAFGRNQRVTISREASLQEKLERALDLLCTSDPSAVGDSHEIGAVGHRIVHGGAEFEAAVLVDARVEASIRRFGAFSPLHNPVQVEAISVVRDILGKEIPQIAVFDTAFHRTLSAASATYAGPYEWVREGILRYGFHGTSFRYASHRVAGLCGRTNDPDFRVIICHLGGGCSLAAVRGGRCVDTTMGFTPLDGIAMCTRSGAIDPGILIYLMREGKSADEIETILNKKAGLAGLSGLRGDTRIIRPAAEKGNARAALAMDVFVHRLRAGIGAMLASLGGLDALVFTDAIGETEPSIRRLACESFGFLGLKIDPEANTSGTPDVEISTTDSRVRVLVLKSEEDWQVGVESYARLNSR
jgi:acetate kinase